METRFCLPINAFVQIVPNTKPQKFDGSAAFFYDELVNLMDRFGNLTYIGGKSFAACTAMVRSGSADMALVWENYPMPEEDNITQTNMLRSDQMVILSGFNQTKPFKAPPDLMVFSAGILSLFILTSIIITFLYTFKMLVTRQHMSLLRKPHILTNYYISILSESCEVIFLTQPLKDHLLGFFLGTFLFFWTSTSLVVFYCSYLNTKQLVFNPPHLIKSYKQIEKEGIRPLYTSEMNDLALIEESRVYDAEYRIKELIHRYGAQECQIPIQGDPDAMARAALKLQHQRDVIIINEQIAPLTKIMMCAVTVSTQPNLTFYSHMDEHAAKHNLQIVYSATYMATKTGRLMRQFIDRLYMVAQLGRKPLEIMNRLSDIFYIGFPSHIIARHKKTCASNYFEVLDPSIDPVETVITSVLYYLIALAILVLFLESYSGKTIGLLLNYHNRTHHSLLNEPASRSRRPNGLHPRHRIVIANAPVHNRRR